MKLFKKYDENLEDIYYVCVLFCYDNRTGDLLFKVECLYKQIANQLYHDFKKVKGLRVQMVEHNSEKKGS